MNVTMEDFASMSFHHEVVRSRPYQHGECCRFHLLFSYPNGRGGVASGEQVVLAPDMAQAAAIVARDRGTGQVLVKKRFFSGKPASQAEIINRVFDIA